MSEFDRGELLARTMSRRRLLRWTVWTGVSLPGLALLAACGADDAPEASPTTTGTGADVTSGGTPASTGMATSTTSTAMATPAASPEAVFPVTIEHKYGSTTISEAPERVLALGYNEQDPILAVGVVPVAVRYWFGDESSAVFPWARDELGAASPEILNMTFGELDFEAIAALRPDLILGVYSGITEDEYATLSRIAPTVAQSGEYVDFGVPWQETTLTVGRALGRLERAEELVAEVEARFTTARADHPEWAGKTVVVGSPDGSGQFGFVASQDPRARIFTSLGFTVPAELDTIAGGQFYGTISLERADLLDQDLLVFHQMQWVKGGRAAIEADPLLSQLNAMREGRVLFIDGDLDDAVQFATVLSLPFALDRLVPMIEDALGGGSAAAGAAFPVTIEHRFGAIEIAAEPARVATIGFSEQDAVLALGVTPVAVREWFGKQPFAVWPWARDELGDAEPTVLTMAFGELDFEAIAALEPDLLVATHSGITQEEYGTLARIAPTLAQSGDYPDFGMPWQEQTRAIARALGRGEPAEALIAEVERAIADAAAANPAFAGATIAWASPSGDGQFWAVGPNTPPMRFLSALGFRLSDELTAAIGTLDSARIAGEQVNLLDADVLIMQVATPEERAAIEQDPLSQQLGAIQGGRTIFFVGLEDPIYAALSFSTVLSLPFVVDELTPILAGTIEGASTTP